MSLCVLDYVGKNELKVVHNDERREKDLKPVFALLCLDLLLEFAKDLLAQGQQYIPQRNVINLCVHDWGDWYDPIVWTGWKHGRLKRGEGTATNPPRMFDKPRGYPECQGA